MTRRLTMFGRSSKTALLQEVPLFRDLSGRQLDQIGHLADEVDVPAGKVLARAGEHGHELFVIVKGQAVARIGQRKAVRLGPGEFFGEMSLVDGGPRSADVEAVTAMRMLVIGRREFWQLLNAAPPVVLKIMSTLSRRVRDAEGSTSA